MTEKTYYHTPTTLMERIKYKMDVPYVCHEDAINDDDEYFFQEESEEMNQNNVLHQSNEMKEMNQNENEEEMKTMTKEEINKHKEEMKPKKIINSIKKKEILSSDEEIRKEIDYVVNELKKRNERINKQNQSKQRNGTITVSRKMNERQGTIPTSVINTNQIIDLRKSDDYIVFLNDKIPEVLRQTSKQPIGKKEDKKNMKKYHFPLTGQGFDSLKEYKLLKLNASIKELEQIKMLTLELDKSIEKYKNNTNQ